MNKFSDKLTEAKTILRERGWFRGGFENNDGAMCIMGAVNTAFNGKPASYDYKGAGDVRKLLQSCIPDDEFYCKCEDCQAPGATPYRLDMSIETWNDKKAKTINDVFGILDCAIAKDDA